MQAVRCDGIAQRLGQPGDQAMPAQPPQAVVWVLPIATSWSSRAHAASCSRPRSCAEPELGLHTSPSQLGLVLDSEGGHPRTHSSAQRAARYIYTVAPTLAAR
jgi:hypothetical protein